MAVGWKMSRTQGRHFMRGQDVSDRKSEISARPCFSVRNCYLCVCFWGNLSCRSGKKMQKERAERGTERRCEDAEDECAENAKIEREPAEDTENAEDTERKGYGGVYDKAVLPSQAWGGRALCRMQRPFEIFAGKVGQLSVR